MNKTLLNETKNNKKVFICDETLKHMEAHPDVSINHVKEAIKNISLDGGFFMESVDMGRVVGKDHCIYVAPENWRNVKMVKRPNRKGLTPTIVLPPVETTLLTIGICMDDDGLYTIFTAFYGVKAPKEPWDTNSDSERSESEKFWACHALCVE